MMPGTDLVHTGALPALGPGDRCDACPRLASRAYVAVRLEQSGRRLYLCAHHWRRHFAALFPLTDSIIDQTGAVL